MAKEKIFIDGMIIKKPHANAPDFVKCSMSFKMVDFIAFARKHQKDGWINADLKVSKDGKLYAELDTWEPKQDSGGDDWSAPNKEPEAEAKGADDDIPF